MNNPAQALDQTALLIAHTAAWSRIINEATPTPRSDGDWSIGPAVPVADRAPRPQRVRCAEGTAPQTVWAASRRSTTSLHTHPALARKAQEMNLPNPTTSPPSTPSSPAQTRLSPEAARAALRAARYAVAAYPGPIGELISRELHSYVDAGEQVHAPALAARLILALERGEAQHPLPPIHGDWRHLPAQYIPGSPMHWRYRTSADDTEESNPDNR